VTAAHHEAYRYASGLLGSAHLLLGLLADTERPVTSALTSNGATPEMIRQHFEQVSGARPHQPPRIMHLPYTPHAKAILISAAACADGCSAPRTSADDVWRALTDVAGSAAARILTDLGQLDHVQSQLPEVAPRCRP
jgi:ATP-dependent Clp protease ATP-binding subunit ClpC